MEIGQRIQISREQAGLTQEHLAEQIDLSAQFVSTMERGIYGASLETLVRLCTVLDVTSDWLLLGKRDIPTAKSVAERLSPLSDDQLIAMDRIIAELVALICAHSDRPSERPQTQ